VISLNIISGPSEIVQHNKNGLLIAERSLPLFAEALQNICFDETLYKTLKENTKPSVTKFSMQAISEKWNQTLQHAIR
jgi:glycosyltransferase involved in cell wall biosynthesis